MDANNKPAATNLPTRADYLRRTLEIITVDEWSAVVNTALQFAKAGDHQARAWLSHQAGMGQQAGQVHINIQSSLEATHGRALTAANLRHLSKEDLQVLAQAARDRYARRDGDVVDVVPPKELKAPG
jgi:hypothetical protein